MDSVDHTFQQDTRVTPNNRCMPMDSMDCLDCGIATLEHIPNSFRCIEGLRRIVLIAQRITLHVSPLIMLCYELSGLTCVGVSEIGPHIFPTCPKKEIVLYSSLENKPQRREDESWTVG